MNKKQKICMWVSICLFSLILIFPNSTTRKFSYGTYNAPRWKNSITRTKLCLIVGAITGGLIVTLKDKKNKKE